MQSKFFLKSMGLILIAMAIFFVSPPSVNQIYEKMIGVEREEVEPDREQKNDPLDKAKSLRGWVDLDVPFSAQAPFGDWGYPYQEACEEVSLMMVHYYDTGEPFSLEIADQEIVKMVEWQTERGYKQDIDVAELAEVALDYYGRNSFVYYDEEVTVTNIKLLLTAGYPVIIPAAGQLLGNPNFTGAGPAYHMLVIVGYDTEGFITNDPGTRNGEKYHYSFDVLMEAIHDWHGLKSNILQGRKAMMVLEKMS